MLGSIFYLKFCENCFFTIVRPYNVALRCRCSGKILQELEYVETYAEKFHLALNFYLVYFPKFFLVV